MSDAAQPNTVTVPIKPAWSSKINWVQAVAIVSAVMTMVGGPKVGLTPEQQASSVVVITMLQGAFTWVMRTWFTTAIVAQSVPPAPPVTVVKTN